MLIFLNFLLESISNEFFKLSYLAHYRSNHCSYCYDRLFLFHTLKASDDDPVTSKRSCYNLDLYFIKIGPILHKIPSDPLKNRFTTNLMLL